MKTTKFQISGMNCQACVAHIEKAMEAVPGVQSVHINLHAGQAVVEHTDADEGKLLNAVTETGYGARLSPADE